MGGGLPAGGDLLAGHLDLGEPAVDRLVAQRRRRPVQSLGVRRGPRGRAWRDGSLIGTASSIAGRAGSASGFRRAVVGRIMGRVATGRKGLSCRRGRGVSSLGRRELSYRRPGRRGRRGAGVPIEVEGRTIAVFLEGAILRDRRLLPAPGRPALRRHRLRRSVTCPGTAGGSASKTADGSTARRTCVGTYPGPGRRRRDPGLGRLTLAGIGFRRRFPRPADRSLPPMRAAYIEQTGPPEVDPGRRSAAARAGPGQVLVRVGATAAEPDRPVHPVGADRDADGVPLRHRLRPGRDGRGGRAGRRAGSRSATGSGARTRGCSGGRGSTAEYAAVDEDWLYPDPARPRRHRGRGAWPWSGSRRTSACSSTAGCQAGETVYVPGGSGGVGSMVVQMAKAAGARVATSAGSPERLELCRELGADLALNYKTDDIPARLREFAPEGVDVWYETQREPEPRSLRPPAPQAGPDDPDGRPDRQARAARSARSTRGTAPCSASPCSTPRPTSNAAAPRTSTAGSRRGSSRPIVGRDLPPGRGRRGRDVPRREHPRRRGDV